MPSNRMRRLLVASMGSTDWRCPVIDLSRLTSVRFPWPGLFPLALKSCRCSRGTAAATVGQSMLQPQDMAHLRGLPKWEIPDESPAMRLRDVVSD